MDKKSIALAVGASGFSISYGGVFTISVSIGLDLEMNNTCHT